MPPLPCRARRACRSLIAFAAVVALAAGVAADGPVDTVTGVTQTFDNDEFGETWGRAGGRNLEFTVTNTSIYSTLNWGMKAGTMPGAAFDGAIDEPGETMSLDLTPQPLGQARWVGQAELTFFGGATATLSTRFTLTVTNLATNAAVAIGDISGGAMPGIDVKATGSFKANLLFEALYNGTWQPLLTLYDGLATPPGNPPHQGGPVQTSFSRAFYYTLAGMTIEQHDQNITNRLNNLGGQIAGVKNDTAFLVKDMPGQFTSTRDAVGQVGQKVDMANSALGRVESKVNDIQQAIGNLPGGITLPDDLARRNDIDGIREFLMVLAGFMPCPQEPEEIKTMCEAATVLSEVATEAAVNEIGAKLNTLATQASVNELRQHLNNVQASIGEIQQALRLARRLELQVTELTEPTTTKRRRWLVRTSVNGVPATAELAGLHAISSPTREPAVPSDVTAMATVRQLMPGVMEVVLEVGSPTLADVAFHFSVRHSSSSDVLEAQSLIGDLQK